MVKVISFRSCVSLVSLIVLTFSVAGNTIAAPTSAYPDDWVDNFSSTTLDGRWTWIRENPLKWSLTDNPGFLRLITSGTLHGVGGNLENLLTTPTPSDDFQVTTKITFSPTENLFRAGVMIYGDDDNLIFITKTYVDGPKVRAVDEVNGIRQVWDADITSDTVYLRIQRAGTLYLCLYSLDGNVWVKLAQSNRNLLNPKIGLGAEQGPSMSEYPADFDFVEVESMAFNSTWEDPFTSTILDSRWAWIRENSLKWSLTDNPGFLRLITSGSLHGIGGDLENLLTTPTPNGDFQVTTKITFSPTENYLRAGVMIYQDDDNYLFLTRAYADGAKVRAGDEVDGVRQSYYADISSDTVYLRIQRVGALYICWYGLDGNNWLELAQVNRNLVNPIIGLGASIGPSVLETPADFDFVEMETLKSIYLPLVVR